MSEIEQTGEKVQQTKYQLSLNTQMLCERLRKETEAGAIVKYEDLSEVIAKDVRRAAKHLLASARHVLERDENMVWAPVRNVGLELLSDTGVVYTGPCFLRKAHRAAKRGGRRMRSVRKFSDLPNEAKILHNTVLSQAGVMILASSGKSTQRIRAAVEANSGELVAAKRSLELLE